MAKPPWLCRMPRAIKVYSTSNSAPKLSRCCAAAWPHCRGIKGRLTSQPLSCSLAPESEDLGSAVRQLIVQRYRVLFIVEKKTVTILHVRGPYGDFGLRISDCGVSYELDTTPIETDFTFD